jgi:DNA-binding response OmpR family regulator
MTKEGPRAHSAELHSLREGANQNFSPSRPSLFWTLSDPDEHEMIAQWANRVGFSVRGEGTWDWAACNPGTIILLEGSLIADPIQACRRARDHGLLLLILLSPDACSNPFEWFCAGAVDFVRRPYLPADLFARVLRCHLAYRPKAGSRADRMPTPVALRLSVEGRGCQLSTSTTSVYLRPSEYALFEYLARATPRFVDHTEIVSIVLRTHGSGASVRTQVYELRRKLSSLHLPGAIETQKGKGAYRLRPDVRVEFEADSVSDKEILTKI